MPPENAVELSPIKLMLVKSMHRWRMKGCTDGGLVSLQTNSFILRIVNRRHHFRWKRERAVAVLEISDRSRLYSDLKNGF